MRFTIDEAARATGGSFSIDPVSDQMEITSLTWDSRSVEPGALYVALPGERVDGHAFAASAVAAGAVCVLAQHALDQASADQIAAAGQPLSRFPTPRRPSRRLRAHGETVSRAASSASPGPRARPPRRTSCATCWQARCPRWRRPATRTTELGVPKTLLAAEQGTQAVVVEMGMRGAGQLADLCDYVRPDWGLVVNVGESHIELLGSRENIARAKAELLCALPEGTGRAS